MTAPDMFARSARSVGWTIDDGSDVPVGTSYSGEILKIDPQFDRDFYDKTKFATWKNGDKKRVTLVTLATELRDASDPDDNGHRVLYVRGKSMEDAIKAGVGASGAARWEVGGFLAITLADYGEPYTRGGRAPRQFEATYRPPTEAKRAQVKQQAVQAAAQDTPDPWGDVPADPWNAGPVQPTAPAPVAGLDLDGLSPEAKAALLARLQNQ